MANLAMRSLNSHARMHRDRVCKTRGSALSLAIWNSGTHSLLGLEIGGTKRYILLDTVYELSRQQDGS